MAAVSTPRPPDEDPSKIVRQFFAKGLGNVDFRCRAWRHVQKRHAPVNSLTHGCIKRVLAEPAATITKTASEWIYELSFRGGDYAKFG